MIVKSKLLPILFFYLFLLQVNFFCLPSHFPNIYTEGKNLIARLGSKYDLRTLVALHLAVYVQLAQLNEVTLVSADNLCNVAMELEYPVINPIGKSGSALVKVFAF
jgi:hypothetical protein